MIHNKCTQNRGLCGTVASQLASYVFVFHVLGSLYVLVLQFQKEIVNSKWCKTTLWANMMQKTKCCAISRLEKEHVLDRIRPRREINVAPQPVQVLPSVTQEI